ncbi:MAG: hypothetical protein NT120_01435 [Candidatus Aenigmarchaeota archaeon]|nr:hypothetical protein [Candidatus Aenigmarchaeota archaeon]
MKYIIFLFVLLMAANAYATNIASITITPQDLWLGDSLNITATCVNNDLPIDRVYADIAGAGIIIPSLDLQSIGSNTYSSIISGTYFDRRGDFNATVFCVVNGTKVNSSSLFSISDLTGQITSAPMTYIGNVMEIDVIPKKNNVPIISDISFFAYLDNSQQSFSMPPIYDSAKGWVLRLAAPSTAKMYNLLVNANYQGKTISMTSTIEIKNAIDFGITSIEKTNLVSNENITVTLKAMSVGSPIQLTTDNIVVSINSASAAIQSISQSGNFFSVRITTPNLSPGSYQLTAGLTYNGSSYTDSEPVNYVTTLSGKFLDYLGKPVNVQMRFYKSGTEKYRINTLSDGTYSSQMVPDTYDVDLELNEATIHLSDANVNSFTNPVKYTYNPGASVEGIATSGVYVIEIPWSFSVATVTLNYDPNNYDDASMLKVFKCSSWNSEKCLTPWTKITPIVYASQKQVSFSVSSFSAFAVGLEDKIKLSMTFDKTVYAKKDLIKVSGATYGQNRQITNVTINLKIDGTYIDQTLNSNGNGVFSYEFLGPEDEGNYTLLVTAKKYPYLSFGITYNIDVESVPALSMIFPGAVQVARGENRTEELILINTGQTDITNVNLGIDLNDKYYKILFRPDKIPVKGEVRIPILFTSDKNDTLTTLSATVNFSSREINQEKIFGFTITEAQPQENAITGFAFAMPSLDSNTIYIIIFVLICFVGVIAVKKMKKRITGISKTYTSHTANNLKKENDVTSYLTDVKNYLNSKQTTLGLAKHKEIRVEE